MLCHSPSDHSRSWHMGSLFTADRHQHRSVSCIHGLLCHLAGNGLLHDVGGSEDDDEDLTMLRRAEQAKFAQD